MSSRPYRLALALALALAAAAPAARAQREGYAYLSWVGPEVALVSVAEDDAAARPNTPILSGDRLVTSSSSRAEAILADGDVLRLDVQSSLRFDRIARTFESDDDRNSVYLERGALALEQRYSTTREQATRVDTDDATVLFPDRGLLRVETGRRGTEVYVVSGRAEVYARSGRATLRAGQYAFASGDADLEVDWLDAPRDGFTRFVTERRDLADGRSGGAYVSDDYVYDYAAADFDRYGSWVYVASTGGYCWRPSVAFGWRPYVEGYWRWSPAGLTWVSYEPWGWMPYHYGTWIWDAGFGWCWSPGVSYSPAWVYWSYTPSWIGWCPMGYYGGYYGGNWDHDGGSGPYWARSGRKGSGSERWTHAYPHLRGRVDVARIDPRGWSYTSTSRIGNRLDARRDVLSHDRVGFAPGDRGVVATTPLRIDRGRGPVTTAVQDAVRRVPVTSGPEARGGGLSDLTPVLRRDAALGSAVRDELRRAFVTPGRDTAYRPLPADQIATPRREGAGGGTAQGPARGADRAPAASTSLPTRGADAGLPSRGPSSGPTRDAWRDGTTSPEPRAPSGTASNPRRDADTPLGGGFGRDRDVRGDDGWRSPGTGTTSGTTAPSRTFDVPSRRPGTEDAAGPERGRREAAPEQEPWKTSTSSAPRRETAPAPETSPRREATAPRGDEGWRGGTPPRSGEAPRTAPAPRSEAPPARAEEAPRSAPAPRYEAPPARSNDAPPARSYEAPRAAPAPRYEAPPARTYEAPRSAPAPAPAPAPRSYEAPRSAPAPAPPASSSSEAPRRSGAERG